MGGGSSSSQESSTETTTYNYDEDIVLEGGGVGVGREGTYIPQTTEEDAQGVQALNSTVAQMDDSHLYVLGDNSSLNIKDLDTETENVLLRALEVSARNAENFMNLTAGNEIENPQGEFETAEVQVIDAKAPTDALKWVISAGVVVGILWTFKGGKKQ